MLSAFNPARELDRLTEQLFSTGTAAHGMPMDLYRSGDHYVLSVDVPGVDPGSIDISVDRGVLSIRAVRSAPTRDGVDWVAAERPTGTFLRQLRLGDALDPDRIHASYTNGVLTLTLPVAEAAKPRKITVTVPDDEGRTIDSTATQPAVDAAADPTTTS